MARRRALLGAPMWLLPGMAGLSACATGPAEPEPMPPLVSGYRHLTPLRLNLAELDLAEPAPGAVRVDEPVPLRPEREMTRMAEDRIVPMGTEGRARFQVLAAEFRRERLAAAGGLGGFFAGEPGERLACRLACRLEVLSPEGRRLAFVEAEARRGRTLPDGSSPAARRRAAEETVRQAMDELNVEFEFQLRRTLRAWLSEGAAPAAPAPVEREELPRG